ncbi:MAG: PilT/PilU family type 4a pilus ATPase [Candidatus Sumerlaeia bacterium]|nr:PilT/PilU family type 4a pilus ATPase [Candidatus Sumerlaeia bacterium]
MTGGLPERDEMFLALAQEQKLLTGGRVFSLRQEQPFYPEKSIGELAALKGFLTTEQTTELYRLVEERLRGETSAPQPESPPEVAPSLAAPAASTLSASEPEPAGAAAVVQADPEGRQTIGGESVRAFSTLEQYLEFTRANQASDLHLSSGYPPFVRRFGEFCFLDRPPLTSDEVGDLIFPHLDAAQHAALEKNLNLEMALEIPGQGRYRTTVIRQRLGWDGCFRVIQSRIPTVVELGFPETVLRLADYRQGMILVTGPGGCGKTTTMAALAEYINTTRHEHIITLEQPIEFVFVPKKAHITQRQVGSHTESYQRALRAALREDPDVILMGEMRDLETIALAITAAETGHLVLATLHTTTAARTISRILDSFPPHQQPQIRTMIAESLRGIICQQLIPRLDRTGVALAIEILVVTPGISSLIREMKLHQVATATQTGKRLGMVRMDDSLMDLYQKGIISIEEAYARADDKRVFAPLLTK